MNNILDDELNGSFVRPGRDYKGDAKADYTEGSRLLMLQCKEPQDSSVYFIWAFLYIHILIAKNRKEAIKLAWNRDEFRDQLLGWIEDKTEDDRTLATNIVSEMIEEASRAKVSVVLSGNITSGND
jgi:hypothetical protein